MATAFSRTSSFSNVPAGYNQKVTYQLNDVVLHCSHYIVQRCSFPPKKNSVKDRRQFGRVKAN